MVKVVLNLEKFAVKDRRQGYTYWKVKTCYVPKWKKKDRTGSRMNSWSPSGRARNWWTTSSRSDRLDLLLPEFKIQLRNDGLEAEEGHLLGGRMVEDGPSIRYVLPCALIHECGDRRERQHVKLSSYVAGSPRLLLQRALFAKPQQRTRRSGGVLPANTSGRRRPSSQFTGAVRPRCRGDCAK